VLFRSIDIDPNSPVAPKVRSLLLNQYTTDKFNEQISSFVQSSDEISKKYIKDGVINEENLFRDIVKGKVSVNWNDYDALAGAFGRVSFNTKDEETITPKNPPKKSGGFSINFNGGVGTASNDNIRVQSTYSAVDYTSATNEGTERKNTDMSISSIEYTSGNPIIPINYTGGYFDPETGLWDGSDLGKKIEMAAPSIAVRNIPVHGKAGTKGVFTFVDIDHITPISKAALLSWAYNKNVKLTLEEAEQILINTYKTNPSAKGKEVGLSVDENGIYHPIIKAASSNTTTSAGKKQVTQAEYDAMTPSQKMTFNKNKGTIKG
jgi:hypothetical protein